MNLSKWLPLERTVFPSVHEWIGGFSAFHKKNPSLAVDIVRMELNLWDVIYELVPALRFLFSMLVYLAGYRD
jgi:hypothetical protein